MIDEAQFEVVAGNGGDGAISFHREKFVPYGGPDGGDGGRGGDVVLVVASRLSTLAAYRDGRPRRAQDGQAGSGNQRRGASASDLELAVPAGTVVWAVGENGDREQLADLDRPDARVVVARGGRGGWGNRRFATPTRKTPRFAQSGQRGQRRLIHLELKLLADVGLIGLPNAGKSTLLRSWSRATPKVASYAFTTLEPELGVVELSERSFVAADMPGLIKGASEGIGLGHEFLRHIERTRVLVHVLDASRDDPLADRELINAELDTFGHGLGGKPQVLALNKVDDPDARAPVELLTKALDGLGVTWFPISGATGEGVQALAEHLLRLLESLDIEQANASDLPVLEPAPRRSRFEVDRDDQGVAIVRGVTPEWLAETLDLDTLEPRLEFFHRMRELGVHRALHRLGVRDGDPVRIGEVEVEWEA